ncbi:uncharacterized protein LTR77_003627 [Saxophila tyrrhenica]|uniref:WD40 repeat-like protein n=1 Tax=Saxophila tyrrhenica TaxID=1690608 RepID=A0AAV9PE68_9PEZI|nr:hypothetical protein LTR77_003627 [Saxophila tyrrhenica]
MDTLLQHAYIARLDETLFCPSSTAAIDSPFPLSSIFPPPASPNALEDANASHERRREGVPVRVDGVERDRALLSSREEALSRSSIRPLDRGHPPPPAELWSHEAGERTPDRTYWQHTQAELLPRPAGHLDQSGELVNGLIIPTQDGTHHALGFWESLDSILHSSRPPLSSYAVDHSAVIVDDHRGSYDFSDFLQRWNRRDSEAPASVQALQPNDDNLEARVQDVAREDTHAAPVDMQGIRWDIAVRSTALSTRRCWHPTSTKYVSPPSIEGPAQALRTDAEANYCFRRFSPKHRAQISHHQLRNTLAANRRNDVFYAAGDKVYRTSLASSETHDTIIDLSPPTSCASGFRITCLAASPQSHADNFVIAGGFNGEYAMLDLSAEHGCVTEGFVSHAYNGVVTHISTNHDRRSGLLQAAFCSNDRTLRIMDAATERFTNIHRFDRAVNCSAVSATNRLRVVVGDSEQVYITDADRGEMLATLHGHNDHIFSCAWSPDGRTVATGAEDRKVIIWDARNWRHALATRTCMISSARSLHFTDDGFLVAAEDEDVVCVYEPRNFDLRQSVRFFGSISGVALLDGGAEMVIANGDRMVGGLMSFQRADQGRNDGSYGRRLDDWVDLESVIRPRRGVGRHSWAGAFEVMV